MAGNRDRSAEILALGNAVRRRRQNMGMTLDELAAASGISRVMIVAIEHGTRNPGVRSLFNLASALGVSASELVKEAEVDQTS